MIMWQPLFIYIRFMQLSIKEYYPELLLKKKKAKLSWKKASGVSGYQIQYSRNKNFKTKVKKKTIKSAATLKATVKSLTARKTWYFRIRSYTRIKDPDGNIVTRYGKWSTKVKCKAKK